MGHGWMVLSLSSIPIKATVGFGTGEMHYH